MTLPPLTKRENTFVVDESKGTAYKIKWRSRPQHQVCEMFDLWEMGYTLLQIGAAYGITDSRVAQIFRKAQSKGWIHHPFNFTESVRFSRFKTYTPEPPVPFRGQTVTIRFVNVPEKSTK